MPLVNAGDAENGCVISADAGGNLSALPVQQGDADLLTGLEAGDKGPDSDLGVGSVHSGGDLDAGAAIVAQVKMRLGKGNEVHIPVQAAVEGEVGHLGIDGVVGGVVHGDGKNVFFLQRRGKVYPPGGVAAVVVGQVRSVQVDIRGGVGAPDFQEVGFCRGKVRLAQGLCVPGGSPVVVVAAVLSR